jgi:hypothetical protein
MCLVCTATTKNANGYAATKGRPPLDRQLLLNRMAALPGGRRGLVLVNERKVGAGLGWSRATVQRALADLEVAGLVRRGKQRGREGLMVYLNPPDLISPRPTL